MHALLWVVALAGSVTAPHCAENGMNQMQTQYHLRKLQRYLEPISDTAVLLVRQGAQGGGNQSMLHFAARLMRVHDAFEATCHDHHWEEALTHKLCASFIRWQPALETQCQGRGVTSWGEGCVCAGLSTLLRDCRHHVLPWAADSGFCAELRQEGCLHTHPVGGLCKPVVRRHHPSPWRSTHHHHRTKPKHKTWRRHAATQKTKQHAEELVDRVRAGKRATASRFNAMDPRTRKQN